MEKNYYNWYKTTFVPAFFDYLLSKHENMHNLTLVMGGKPIVSIFGVNTNLKQDFEDFLSKRKSIASEFALNKFKHISLHNISNMPLSGPVDTKNDDWMVKSYLRQPLCVSRNLESKTAEEKLLLKRLKKTVCFNNKLTWSNHNTVGLCELKISLKPPKMDKDKFSHFKSTIIRFVYEDDIPDYIKLLTQKELQILRMDKKYV